MLLTSLYGAKVPLAFLVHHKKGNVKICLGTWKAASAKSPSINRYDSILRASVNSLYPAVEMDATEISLPAYELSGLALGIPTPTYPLTHEDPMAIDRLIRAISDGDWTVMVLADPVGEKSISKLRQNIIEEMREVHNATQTKMAPLPLLEHYNSLLKISLEELTSSVTIGAWRTAVYLMGDENSYARLTSIWRGLFAGDKSIPESIRVWNIGQVVNLAKDWIMPETPGQPAPGYYQRPTEFQTILTSKQLAAYVHLPQLETRGFRVSTIPSFDIMPPKLKNEESISVGSVLIRNKHADLPYTININSLTQHAFVSGITGTGKTNTIVHLLTTLTQKDIPFLVIEPAKTEYRALLNDPSLAGKIQIFSLANEEIAPFRLNPFEVVDGTPVAVHLDLLRSVFAASFGMWTPLPQILERCLHEIYEDRGWDMSSNTNMRLDGASDTAAAYPTLTHLFSKVDQVINKLGYGEKLTADLAAALLTRINSLRTGSKGLMLDVRKSVPIEAILEKPTIIELENLGDDDDKAFVIGLLLIRLVSYRRAHPQTTSLRHILVFEEAHRLLTNVSQSSRSEDANPRAKAVETFTHLLSEIRAYGQGVIISDQVPVKLAPDVIKNTNLKIIHRIVAMDDRTVLAGATAMDERQSTALTIIEKGQAAVFSEGDDAPVLVEIPLVHLKAPSNNEVSAYMQKIFANSPKLIPTDDVCHKHCKDKKVCALARQIVEDKSFQHTFARVTLSLLHDVNALKRMWRELVFHIRAKRPHWANEEQLIQCVCVHAAHWFADLRGAQASWSYRKTAEFANKLTDALFSQTKSENDLTLKNDFRQFGLEQHQRSFNPFPGCAFICQQNPPLCLYRSAVQDLIKANTKAEVWAKAEASDFNNGAADKLETWEVCQDAAFAMMEFADDTWNDKSQHENFTAARRASLCFGQHMLGMKPLVSPGDFEIRLAKLLLTSKHTG
jgi:hypothetical protein